MQVKPYKTIDEQISLVASRRLAIDADMGVQWLGAVGYYRLSGYWYPYRQVAEDGDADRPTRLDTFVEGATFVDVVQLYEFDRKLRTLIHDGIERIEVALRSHVGHSLGAMDPLAYEHDHNFRPSFNREAWCSIARKRVNRAARHSEFVRHHMETYGGALPIWVLTEVLDFSDVSRLYEGLATQVQWEIAASLSVIVDVEQLGHNQRAKVLKSHPLVRWFEQLTVLRNTCAHHSRVWNHSFPPASTAGLRTVTDLGSLPEGQSERLYGALAVMAFLLRSVSPGTTWPQKVKDLIEVSFEPLFARDVEEMGFPPGWGEERIWLQA